VALRQDAALAAGTGWRRWQGRVRWLHALIAAHLIVVWLAPVLPAQDLPQHLAYARIILDYDRSHAFRELYRLPTDYQSYYNIYYLLVSLARLVPLESAIRVLFSGYVVALFLGLRLLARNLGGVAGDQGDEPAAMLGTALVWNPVACMGFLSFTLTIPLLIIGAAIFVRMVTSRGAPSAGDRVELGCCCLLIGSLHLVAAACFAAFCTVHCLLARDRGRIDALAFVFCVTVVTAVAWMCLGDLSLAAHPLGLVAQARRAADLDFLNRVFQLSWSDPLRKLNFLAWNVVGPFRLAGQAATAAVLAALLVAALGARPAAPPARSPRTAFKQAGLVMAALAWLLPWGLYVPSEVTFLDFRVMTVACCLLVGAVDGRRFAGVRSRALLTVGCCLLTVHTAYRVLAYGREASSALRLLRRVPEERVLLTLAVHDTSQHFGAQFRLTHFLPMYHTLRSHGINTQFWAKYVEHLPIERRPGTTVATPRDWRPWDFNPLHLEGVDYVIYQRATEDDGDEDRTLSARIDSILRRHTDPLGCDGLWCLYRTRAAQRQDGLR
jgi:hypothetical protein